MLTQTIIIIIVVAIIAIWLFGITIETEPQQITLKVTNPNPFKKNEEDTEEENK